MLLEALAHKIPSSPPDEILFFDLERLRQPRKLKATNVTRYPSLSN
jgi:hypothetical protein